LNLLLLICNLLIIEMDKEKEKEKEKKDKENKYNVIIHSTDMHNDLISEAKKIFCELYEKSVNEKEMASYLKKDFDKKFLGNYYVFKY